MNYNEEYPVHELGFLYVVTLRMLGILRYGLLLLPERIENFLAVLGFLRCRALYLYISDI